MFKVGADNLLRRCVTSEEAKGILWHCHNSPCGGHYGGDKTTAKVLQSGFYWPTLFKDAHEFVVVFLEFHLKIQSCEFGQMTSGVRVLGAEHRANLHDFLEAGGDQHLLVKLW